MKRVPSNIPSLRDYDPIYNVSMRARVICLQTALNDIVKHMSNTHLRPFFLTFAVYSLLLSVHNSTQLQFQQFCQPKRSQ